MSFDWFIDNIIWIALWYFIVFNMAGSLFSQNLFYHKLSQIEDMRKKTQEWEVQSRTRIVRPKLTDVKIDRSKWENGPDRKKIL